MTQHNTWNVKLSNSQVNELKSEIKNGTQVTINLSSNAVGQSNDETNSPHKLLLTNTQVSKICKAFTIGSSTNVKLSKAQLSKMIQLGGFLSRLLGPLLKTDLSLLGNVLKPLAKSVSVPSGLTSAASATDQATHKKVLDQAQQHLYLQMKTWMI